MDVLGLANPIDEDADAVVRGHATKAVALARMGHQTEAERLARAAVDMAWQTEYVDLRALSQEALARVLVSAGRTAEAADALERAIGVYEAKENVVAAAKGRAALAELKAAADASE
jgi:hypothetical protein